MNQQTYQSLVVKKTGWLFVFDKRMNGEKPAFRLARYQFNQAIKYRNGQD